MEKELMEKINIGLDKLIKEYEGDDTLRDMIAWGLKIAKEKVNHEVRIYELEKDLEKYKKIEK